MQIHVRHSDGSRHVAAEVRNEFICIAFSGDESNSAGLNICVSPTAVPLELPTATQDDRKAATGRRAACARIPEVTLYLFCQKCAREDEMDLLL